VYPQLFLRTFWRTELRPQVFVAMSFAGAYESRFEDVIAPAVRRLSVDGRELEPHRVDLSKTGDSILTEIMDGIAHSQLVLADVSVVGRDAVTGLGFRNGNVMYEVGLALACRDSAEVLLVRDDQDRFLFDVSTIPHLNVNFAAKDAAVNAIHEALQARLREQNYLRDARVQLAIAGLSTHEAQELKELAKLPVTAVWGPRGDTMATLLLTIASVPRLLDKGLLRLAGQFTEGHSAYELTQLGRVVAEYVRSDPRQFVPDQPPPSPIQPSASETSEQP
jgi:hypothetical protein